MIATTALQLSGWYMFALLVLPFAGAYGASTYRALQIQAYRHPGRVNVRETAGFCI